MKEGDVVRYGQHVTLTTLPGVGGQVGVYPQYFYISCKDLSG